MQARDTARSTGQADRNIFLFTSVLQDHIWKYRNHIVHGGSPKTRCPFTIPSAKAIALSFELCNPSPLWPPLSTPCWSPPPLGWVKVNFDATIGAENAMVVVMARNNLGEILCWHVKRVPSCFPMDAEALAAE